MLNSERIAAMLAEKESIETPSMSVPKDSETEPQVEVTPEELAALMEPVTPSDMSGEIFFEGEETHNDTQGYIKPEQFSGEFLRLLAEEVKTKEIAGIIKADFGILGSLQNDQLVMNDEQTYGLNEEIFATIFRDKTARNISLYKFLSDLKDSTSDNTIRVPMYREDVIKPFGPDHLIKVRTVTFNKFDLREIKKFEFINKIRFDVSESPVFIFDLKR